MKGPYTFESLSRRVKRTKLIRYPKGHELAGKNLYLLEERTIRAEYARRRTLFAKASIYFTPDDDKYFLIVVWRINGVVIDWLQAKNSMKRARSCSNNAIWATEGFAEHTVEYDRDVNDVIGNYYKDWRMCM